MGVNDLKKWNYAQLLTRPSDSTTMVNILENISREEHIRYIKKKVKISLPSRAVVLDFEGNPVFLLGIMLENILYSFYIEDYEYRNELYLFLMDMIDSLEKVVYFTFSSHEKEEIKRIYQYLGCQGKDLSKYITVDKIPIINLQLSKFESLLEALYSISPDMKITGDALFRNSRLVDQLFYAKKYNEIVTHNHNCLQNECNILQKRWLKLYTV
jgi:hypothetical protein